MTTEATTGGRARSADGRFASKATGAAVIDSTEALIPATTPELAKRAKKADSKKSDAKKAEKKAEKKADSKKSDAKKAEKKAEDKKSAGKKTKSKSGGKKKKK